MGLFDKLKNVVESEEFKNKVKSLSNDVIKITTEEDRIAAQKKLEEDRIAAEKAKQEKFEQMLKPSCDKGDCLWYKDKFYFTCDCDCERKNFSEKGTLRGMEFWPYMKQIEAAEKIENFQEREEIKERINTDFVKEFFITDFQKENGLEETLKKGIPLLMMEIGCKGGFEADNNYLTIVLELANLIPFNNENLEKIIFLGRACFFFTFDDTLAKFYLNPSLYDRSQEDFESTVKLYNKANDKELLSKYFIDISNISTEQFFDADGNVKPFGKGGPQKGFYGDTLWNLVEYTWGGKNGENNKKQ